MRSAKAVLLLSWLTAVPTLASSPSTPPTPDAAPADTFTGRVSVLEVVVPVRVLANRVPVTGLRARDFVVTDRGTPQEIVGFEVVDLRDPAEAGEVAASARATPAPEATVGRSLLLLFDTAFSHHFSSTRALDGARRMVAGQLHPADRVAVAYFSGFHGIQFVSGFTADRDHLATALDVVESVFERKPDEVAAGQATLARSGQNEGTMYFARLGRQPEAPNTRGSRARTRLGPPGGLGAPLPPEPIDFDKAAAQSIMVPYIRVLAQSLTETVEMLAGVSGTRHILFFSEGFRSLNPASSLGTKIMAELEPMRQAFLRTGWILQSIDLKGVPVDYAKFSNNALFFLANETGGELFDNYNKFEQATAKFIERSRLTYVLTYRALDVAADGRFHKIDVELADGRSDVHIRHRPGYYAPKEGGAR